MQNLIKMFHKCIQLSGCIFNTFKTCNVGYLSVTGRKTEISKPQILKGALKFVSHGTLGLEGAVVWSLVWRRH